MDRSNAGQRILNSKLTLRGAEDALENYIGQALQDGCQCFVHAEQANYRFLASSQLKADGQYILAPHTGPGRWHRESGLVGFALLEGGKLGDALFFSGYTYQKLVQFEVTPEALVYVGTIPRLAHLSAAHVGDIGIVLLQGETRLVASGCGSTNGAALLHPGERIRLRSETAFDITSGEPASTRGPASLQVILA